MSSEFFVLSLLFFLSPSLSWAACDKTKPPIYITAKTDGHLFFNQQSAANISSVIQQIQSTGATCAYFRAENTMSWKDLKEVIGPLSKKGRLTPAVVTTYGHESRSPYEILMWEAD
ncbi:hypothetical protein PMI41_00198 [Phyllobacterium sp. YR531]|nr:hypothetical protein PMI41_00198 [Phyllobacterium sp. YR531]